MRIGIISDIHGNLVALESVLHELAKDHIDHIVCLGDVAADGPQPREVIARLRQVSSSLVMGNMDAWLLSPRARNVKSERVRRITEIQSWGASQLSPDDLDYLRTFRQTIEFTLDVAEVPANLLCFHGSPTSNEEGISPRASEEELEQVLTGCMADVMACGHTHTQMLRRIGVRSILNPGSVGAPRCPPWAEYAVLQCNNGSLRLELRRVLPNVDSIVEAALSSGMPHPDWWIQDRTGRDFTGKAEE